ncbi:MAG: dipicolinate synthase subunit B [Ruminococcus flavefaciens]|nr:dipicolinate synthase subunit B [Ruminococcus flavefaciens]
MQNNHSKSIGFAITGSFCTHAKIIGILEDMVKQEYEITPIFSPNVVTMNTRFGEADSFVERVEKITGHSGIYTIQDAEPIGPKKLFDALVIAPCTGNTIAKLANGITDTPVLMAAKAHLRNERPLILSISTNDAMGINFRNIGLLFNMKYLYFVPFGQDDAKKKHNSLISHVELIPETIEAALQGRQLQPVIQAYNI